MSIYQCSIEVEERKPRENHLIYIVAPALISKNALGAILLLKSLLLVQVMNNLKISDDLNLVVFQFTVEATVRICCFNFLFARLGD